MQTIAIALQKGGSGKTSTTVNLGATLAESGKRVLVIDCDPQGNASSWLGVREPGKGVYGALVEGGALADVIVPTAIPNLSVAPSSPWLVGAERALAAEVGAETILRRKLVPLADRFDIILVDTPPTLGVLTVGALAAADYVLAPCAAHALCLAGLSQLTQTITAVIERLNDKLKLIGIAACRVDARTKHGPEVVAELRRRFPAETFETVIRESVRMAEAPSFGEPITVYDPKGSGAEDYRALARELMERM